ncbi:MAG: tetratricopeptide repeat protein [Bacteroidetes bacterium]|nr:tetratricopeptide repeat protein [Bacteroidota bacterium]
MAIKKGNRYYKEQKFDESQKAYKLALQQSPGNAPANYNLGNAEFRKNSFADAAKSYDDAIDGTKDSALKEQSYYNKGVAYIKQQKLEESIDAWKSALKLDPNDEEARDNLEKALRELKNKQQQQQQNNNNKKNQQQKQDKKDQQNQDQQQKSKLTKQQVEQLLKALQQKEKDEQEKMNQNKQRSVSQPDKDW